MNVLSFDPSFWCSSTSGASAAGASAGSVAAGGAAADEVDVNAHMVQPRRASLDTAQGKRKRQAEEILVNAVGFQGESVFLSLIRCSRLDKG